jgi:geranylgeranyl pyrophosphate synthase
VDEELLVSLLGSAGALQAAKGVAKRLIEEASTEMPELPDNQYAAGLRAIAIHLKGLLEKF